jgi:uncharacterized phage protein (TIGR01671 family)
MLGFRVWDAKNEQMICEADFEAQCDCLGRLIYGHYVPHEIADDIFIPMQSTGIKDESGKIIFQGDILSYLKENHLKYFSVKDANYFIRSYHSILGVLLNGEEEQFLLTHENINKVSLPCKIAGNVYENPELMEKLK